MKRMLVAGVGNIFLGDDGFGCEVIRAMGPRAGPDGVDVVDFGIRGVHLAYQLLDGYDELVIVDAAPRGAEPGTVSLLEVAPETVPDAAPAVSDAQQPLVDAHGMEPGAILAMLGALGGHVQRVRLIACEPLSVDEGIGLSAPVQAAVPAAVSLLKSVMSGNRKEEAIP